jgi:hypothetical protein
MACARCRETGCPPVPACRPRGQQPCHLTRPRPGTAVIVNQHGYLALDESPSVRNDGRGISTARPILSRFKRARGGFGRRSLSIPPTLVVDSAGAPVDAAGTPVDAAGTPVDAAGAPVDAAGTPVDAAGAPVDAAGAPVDAAGTPVDAAGTPVDAAGTPVDAANARGGFGRRSRWIRPGREGEARTATSSDSGGVGQGVQGESATARVNPDGTRAGSHTPRAPIRRREPSAGGGQWSSGRAPPP